MGDNTKPWTETDNWCKTVVGETIKSKFLWTIEGFKRREEKTGEALHSNIFKICDPEGKVTSWCLNLYPRGDVTRSENHVSLYLSLIDDFSLKIDFEMFLLDVSSSKLRVFNEKSREFSNTGWGFEKFLSRVDLENEDWLPDDKLTVGCEINYPLRDGKNSFRMQVSGRCSEDRTCDN